jgi:hypothetical protein
MFDQNIINEKNKEDPLKLYGPIIVQNYFTPSGEIFQEINGLEVGPLRGRSELMNVLYFKKKDTLNRFCNHKDSQKGKS